MFESLLPIWTFHGTNDESVPLIETELLVTILQKAGSKSVTFTVFDGAGHAETWDRAYQNPELWEWLFSQTMR